jgi:hypothetical protein
MFPGDTRDDMLIIVEIAKRLGWTGPTRILRKSLPR